VLPSILSFCSADHPTDKQATNEMPNGLGRLVLNKDAPGDVVLTNHGDENGPQIGRSQAISGFGEPARHVTVRVPYSDQRAEGFIASEARQLPTDAAGLIMIDSANVPGGFQVWEALIARRFQPAIHTRVGGIGLVAGRAKVTDTGLAVFYQAKLIMNPNAKIPLPTWIVETFQALQAEFKAALLGQFS